MEMFQYDKTRPDTTHNRSSELDIGADIHETHAGTTRRHVCYSGAGVSSVCRDTHSTAHFIFVKLQSTVFAQFVCSGVIKARHKSYAVVSHVSLFMRQLGSTNRVSIRATGNDGLLGNVANDEVSRRATQQLPSSWLVCGACGSCGDTNWCGILDAPLLPVCFEGVALGEVHWRSAQKDFVW